MPQETSKQAVKDAQKSGLLKPILANRPAPTVSGLSNFCIPSDRKTNPTIKRGSKVGTGKVLKILFRIQKATNL
jgi:hypothetical protein